METRNNSSLLPQAESLLILPYSATMMRLAAATLLLMASTSLGSIQEVWMEFKTSSESGPARGIGQLLCAPNELQYMVPESEIFSRVFLKPSDRPEAVVREVSLASNSSCKAIRVPAFPRPYFSIRSALRDCGITSDTLFNSAGAYFQFSANVNILVHVRAGAGAFLPIRFRQPLFCRGNASASGNLGDVRPVDLINVLPVEWKDFEVAAISSAQDQTQVGFLGLAAEMQVTTLTLTLQENSRDMFKMFVDRCWMTPTPNENHPARFFFVESAGCPGLIANITKSEDGFEYKVEVMPATLEGFEDATTIHYHCRVHYCLKSTADDRCERACGVRRGIGKMEQEGYGTISTETALKKKPAWKIVNGKPVHV